jgi:hypothetical protein
MAAGVFARLAGVGNHGQAAALAKGTAVNGEYEVHYIGANCPHHIFVNQSFTVVGAN